MSDNRALVNSTLFPMSFKHPHQPLYLILGIQNELRGIEVTKLPINSVFKVLSPVTMDMPKWHWATILVIIHITGYLLSQAAIWTKQAIAR